MALSHQRRAGTLYKIKEKKNVCEAQIVQLLTVSENVLRLSISHNTTTGSSGTDVLLSLVETAAASWRNVLEAAAHSRLELLPLEMPARRWWSVASVVLATSWCRWNADDGVLEHWQWAGDCQTGRLAQWHWGRILNLKFLPSAMHGNMGNSIVDSKHVIKTSL